MRINNLLTTCLLILLALCTTIPSNGDDVEKTFCSIGGAYTAEELWESHGWTQSFDLKKCTFIWLNLVEDYCTELMDKKMERNFLTSRQMVNFFQGEDIFVDKGLLPRYLKRYEQKVCPKYLKADECVETWDVVPELLPIDSERDVHELEQRFIEEKDTKIILKPSDGAGGSGVKVLQHDEFIQFLHSPKEYEGVMIGEDIMQVYFQTPYLLHNHKSEVALYWTLVSIDPLIVYYLDEWQIRRNAEPYDHGQFNPYKHVTNIDAQKSHKKYKELKKSLKWRMQDYKEYINTDRGSGAFEYLFSQMKRSIVRVLNATVPTMKGEEPYIDLPESLLLGYYLEEGCSPWKSNAFSIGTYRSDFMVDELTLRPIMTEVQSNFGAGYKTSAKKYIIPPLFRGMVDIVHEVTHLRSAGRPVNEVVNNISPAHFHLLINEADDFYDDKIKKNRNFKCKSTDGIRCDKYKDPEYTVEIKNKFDENTNMFGDMVDNEKKEETPQILTERELMNDDNEDITPPSFTEFGSGVLSSMDEL